MGLNRYESSAIYEDMLKYRTFPENLFVGAPQEKELLRSQLQNRFNLE